MKSLALARAKITSIPSSAALRAEKTLGKGPLVLTTECKTQELVDSTSEICGGS